MWIFTRYGFFSIACATEDGGESPAIQPDLIMVRARQKRHLDQLKRRFPELAGFSIASQKGTDYRHRIVLPKTDWSNVMLQLTEEQSWSDFKDETQRYLGRDFRDYQQALQRVWGLMRSLQVNERPANTQA
jgi:hypothetical protein